MSIYRIEDDAIYFGDTPQPFDTEQACEMLNLYHNNLQKKEHECTQLRECVQRFEQVLAAADAVIDRLHDNVSRPDHMYLSFDPEHMSRIKMIEKALEELNSS